MKEYDGNSIMIGLCVAMGVVFLLIVAFNLGEIWAIITTERLFCDGGASCRF